LEAAFVCCPFTYGCPTDAGLTQTWPEVEIELN
jgi:hypothetical protein